MTRLGRRPYDTSCATSARMWKDAAGDRSRQPREAVGMLAERLKPHASGRGASLCGGDRSRRRHGEGDAKFDIGRLQEPDWKLRAEIEGTVGRHPRRPTSISNLSYYERASRASAIKSLRRNSARKTSIDGQTDSRRAHVTAGGAVLSSTEVSSPLIAELVVVEHQRAARCRSRRLRN